MHITLDFCELVRLGYSFDILYRSWSKSTGDPSIAEVGKSSLDYLSELAAASRLSSRPNNREGNSSPACVMYDWWKKVYDGAWRWCADDNFLTNLYVVNMIITSMREKGSGRGANTTSQRFDLSHAFLGAAMLGPSAESLSAQLLLQRMAAAAQEAAEPR